MMVHRWDASGDQQEGRQLGQEVEGGTRQKTEAARNSQDRYVVLVVFLRLFLFFIYLLFNYLGICWLAYNSLHTYKWSFYPTTEGMNPQNKRKNAKQAQRTNSETNKTTKLTQSRSSDKERLQEKKTPKDKTATETTVWPSSRPLLRRKQKASEETNNFSVRRSKTSVPPTTTTPTCPPAAVSHGNTLMGTATLIQINSTAIRSSCPCRTVHQGQRGLAAISIINRANKQSRKQR